MPDSNILDISLEGLFLYGRNNKIWGAHLTLIEQPLGPASKFPPHRVTPPKFFTLQSSRSKIEKRATLVQLLSM